MSYFSNYYDAVRYPRETDEKKGLRQCQLGAIHAIASHFTNSNYPAIITMPTGSGKTAILMLSAFVLMAKRVLVLTPSRLVRSQIQEEFKELQTLLDVGALTNVDDKPKVYELKNKILTEEAWMGLRNFDVVVATPMSISPAIDDIPAPPDDIFDLILIDEAHRLGGSSGSEARHILGEGLANSATHLLLLSATPHQGKSEPFWRIMQILDDKAFPSPKALTKEQVAPYVIRTEKRKAINNEGNPLFKNRETFMKEIFWSERHEEQAYLYEEVTRYATEGYCAAKRENKMALGFLMTLMQRMVTSSTRAIKKSLEKRLSVLKEEAFSQSGMNEDELLDMDAQEALENVISIGSYSTKKEIKELERLLHLAEHAERQYSDAKLEQLMDEINSLKRRFGNDEKILIFTEFIATQEYIYEYLMSNGRKVTLINGKMDIEERMKSIEDFAGDCDIMISTDAGGEGLNIQFCHLIINYDLPWNPMKIEQRIGRVDRIGQTKDVIAINFMIGDTVEYRVRKILEEKLRVVMEEFGVDKMADILDSAMSEREAMDMVMNSVMSPGDIEYYVDKYVENVKNRSQYIKEFNDILKDEKVLSKDILDNIKNKEIYELLRNMYVNYMLYRGGAVKEGKNGYVITSRDETRKKISFDPSGQGMKVITLNDEDVRTMMRELPIYPQGQAVPKIRIEGLSNEEGYWSLWQIMLNDSNRDVKIFPFFVNNDWKTRIPSAEVIWEKLMSDRETITYGGEKELDDVTYEELYNRVSDYASKFFYEIKDRYNVKIEEEKKRMNYAFELKREKIERTGLETVKRYRLDELEKEKRSWEDKILRSGDIIPSLRPLCILYMFRES